MFRLWGRDIYTNNLGKLKYNNRPLELRLNKNIDAGTRQARCGWLEGLRGNENYKIKSDQIFKIGKGEDKLTFPNIFSLELFTKFMGMIAYRFMQ